MSRTSCGRASVYGDDVILSEIYFAQALVWLCCALVAIGDGHEVIGAAFFVMSVIRALRSLAEVVEWQ